MNQQNETYRQNMYVGVGVMKDYNLKLSNLLLFVEQQIFVYDESIK